MNIDMDHKKISEPFGVSIPIGESILAEKFYHDCPFSVNHKSIMEDFVELDMVDFDVILCMDCFMRVMPLLIVEFE